ncbi:hypothetical protein LguiB_001156 [Lonicera macranthoides]
MGDQDGEEDYVSGSLGICKNGFAAFASGLNTCETELRSLFTVFQSIMTKYEKVKLRGVEFAKHGGKRMATNNWKNQIWVTNTRAVGGRTVYMTSMPTTFYTPFGILKRNLMGV